MSEDAFVGAVSPAHVLGRFEELTVVLVTVEVWAGRLFLALCAVQDERTRALSDQWARDFEWFASEVVSAREAGERLEPPEQPGVMLNRIPLRVSDDVATAYRPAGKSAGGTGSEWRAQWEFEPGVPTAATVLTVRLDTPQGRRPGCHVSLQNLAFPSS